jgi:hypothetical protein
LNFVLTGLSQDFRIPSIVRVYFKSINGHYSSFLDSRAQWPFGGGATHVMVFLLTDPTHKYVTIQKVKYLSVPLPSQREAFRNPLGKLLNPQAMDTSEKHD